MISFRTSSYTGAVPWGSEMVMTIVKGTPELGNGSPALVDDRKANRQLLEDPRPLGMDRVYRLTGVHLRPVFRRYLSVYSRPTGTTAS